MSGDAPVAGLLAALASEGEAEARALLERARVDAERIRTDCERRIAGEVQRRKNERVVELARSEGAALMDARGASRRSALGARQRLVSRVMDVAGAMLGGATDDAWLEAEVARVARYLPEGEVRIACAPRDVARVKRYVKERAGVRVHADAGIVAGVVAEMADRSLLVDGSLGSRLTRMREEFAMEIVAALEERL